jgi:protein SCO1
MRPHHRLLLPATALLAVLALVAVLALRGSPGASSGGSTRGGSASGTANTGFYGALLPAGLGPHEFTLTDQYGRRLALSELRGHVVILAFLYSTSRSTAPLIAQQIRGALDELGGGASAVPALAVSVDPAADTPAHVRAFLEQVSMTGRLRYLTGTPAQLRAVWHSYAVVPASAGTTAYERSAFVLLLDRQGAERVDFPLEELTPEALAHDVRKLEGGRRVAGR